MLAQMGMLVITARVLGPTGRGEYAAAVTWATTLFTVGCLSLGQVALHRAAERDDQRWLGPTLGSLAVIAFAVTVLTWAGAAIAYLLSDGAIFGDLPRALLVLGLASVPFLIWEQYGSSLLMAVGRLPIYNRAQVMGRTVGLVLVAVLLVGAGLDVKAALVAYVVGQGIVAFWGTRPLMTMAIEPIRPSLTEIWSLLRGGAKLHLNAIGTLLFNGVSVLIVQYYRGAEETGYFQTAVQLLSGVLLIPTAAAMVLYGEVARDGPDEAWPRHRRIMLLLVAGMALAAAVGALIAPWIIPLVLGEAFRPAVPVFQLLTLALVGQTLSVVMAPQWIGRGLFLQVSAASLATGVVSALACLWLVPRHGMVGAAAALLGVYGLSLLGNGGFAWWVDHRVRQRALAQAGRTS